MRDEQVNILVFSVYYEQVYVNRALNAGEKGYITKNSAPEILLDAIVDIHNGHRYVEDGLLKKSSDEVSGHDFQSVIQSFSVREFDVFRLLSKGLTVHKIADELCLGYKTVANYVTQIKKKLKVSSIAELVHIAILLGIVKH